MGTTFHFVKSRKDGFGYIRIRWVMHGTDVRSTLGVSILRDEWNGERSRVYSGARFGDELDAVFINYMLDTLEEHIKDEEQRAGDLADCTASWMRNRLREMISEAREDAFLYCKGTGKHRLIPEYVKFIELMFVRRNWTKATRMNYRKLLPYLEKTAKRMYVEDADIGFVEEFYETIISTLTERTAHNLMTCLRSFFRWCISEYGISDVVLSFTYKSRRNIKDMVYLTSDELKKLASIRFDSSVDGFSAMELQIVRDMFLFCCLTGLRFSDMQRLEWSHVFKNSIRMYTKKTMKLVEIELNPLSREILHRYDNGGVCGFVFPRIDNGTMNKVLKTIGKQLNLSASINRLYFRKGKREEDVVTKADAITTHTGRHTFAVQALSSGVPGSVVMAWTGHSDYDSLKPYIDITSDAKRRAMDKFELFLKDVFEG